MNKIARDISLLSKKNEEMLDTKNARSAESEEYLNKKAIIIQTYGSPQFATKLWFFNLPIRRIKRGCFNVLGFKKTKFYPFFQVPFAEKNKRLKMLNKVYKIGLKL